MDHIQQVWDLVEYFTVKSNYVFIKHGKIDQLAKQIKEKFEDYEPFWLGYPSGVHRDDDTVLYELLAGSVNYQYWYGRHYIRPNEACADTMYKLLDESFFGDNYGIISRFSEKLVLNRFPSIETRIKHIEEVRRSISPANVVDKISNYVTNGLLINDIIELMIKNLPGYASDMFLKRVFLFLMMMYRRLKWFKDEISIVPIPADYQIPKMLNYYDCLYYSPKLQDKIDCHEIIPSGSAMECEIRANSILACKLLAEEAGVTMCDVDTFLWLNRKKSNRPFHLTITTDY